jgi:hypothetical protein
MSSAHTPLRMSRMAGKTGEGKRVRRVLLGDVEGFGGAVGCLKAFSVMSEAPAGNNIPGAAVRSGHSISAADG